jgi:hypothetical protein
LPQPQWKTTTYRTTIDQSITLSDGSDGISLRWHSVSRHEGVCSVLPATAEAHCGGVFRRDRAEIHLDGRPIQLLEGDPVDEKEDQ